MKTILKYSLLLVLLTSCDYIKYSKGVKDDTHKKFAYHKELINHTAFKGTVTNKLYYNNREANKYQITIHIDNAGYKKLKSGWPGFAPLYDIPEHNILNFSVSPAIYKAIKIGESIDKDPNSNNFIIDNKGYSYLSNDKHKWLAD